MILGKASLQAVPRNRGSEPPEHDACQPPGGERPGVDVDAIGQYLRPFGRRMAVNDDFAEIGGAAQQAVILDAAVPLKTVSRSLLWFARNQS